MEKKGTKKRSSPLEDAVPVAKRAKYIAPDAPAHYLADTHLPDPAAAPWDGIHTGSAVNGVFSGKSYLGLPMKVVKSSLQKAVRNGDWKLAFVMTAEGLGNVGLFGSTPASKANATNLIHRLMTIAVEDCAASPHIVEPILGNLLAMLKTKEHHSGTAACLEKVLPWVYQLCMCAHFRPSTLVHAFADCNMHVAHQLGIPMPPPVDPSTTLDDLLQQKNIRAFGVLAGIMSDAAAVSHFWTVHGRAHPHVAEAYKRRSKARDARAYLQYIVAQRVMPPRAAPAPPPAQLDPDVYASIMHAIRQKRYSVDIPRTSIVYDIHTSRHTPEGVVAFRLHANVTQEPPEWSALSEPYVPIYVHSVYS